MQKKHVTKYNLFMLKVLEKSGIQGSYINKVKAIYFKPTVNIKLNRDILEEVPLKSGRIMLTFPKSRALFVSLQKETKGIQIGKEEIKI